VIENLWGLDDQIGRTVTAAHGLSGWLLGRTSQLLYDKAFLESSPRQATRVVRWALDIDISEEEARRRFGDGALFMIWVAWRDQVRIQRFNPVLSGRGDVIDTLRRLQHTPKKKRKRVLEYLIEEVGHLIGNETKARKESRVEPPDVDSQIDSAIEVAYRVREWLEDHCGSCPPPDTSETEALRILGDYELYVVWTGYRDAVRLTWFQPVREISGRVLEAAKEFVLSPAETGEEHLGQALAEMKRLKRAERECAALFPKYISAGTVHPPYEGPDEKQGEHNAPA